MGQPSNRYLLFLVSATAWVACSLGCTGRVDVSAARPGASPAGSGGPAGAGTGTGAGSVSGTAGTGGSVSVAVCKDVSKGGAVASLPLRRLTREQYNNSVRDLLGDTTRPAVAIDADEAVGPFTGNVVTPVSRGLAEQYAQVAETLAAAAVSTRLDALVACDRVSTGEAACASRFIDSFGLRSYRRPLDTDEKARFVQLYAAAAAREGFGHGIQLVIQAMLQSPNFLYHAEFGMSDPVAAPALALGPYELASRLSYFFWSTSPDNGLFEAARTGALNTPGGLVAEARRLLADGRAPDAIASFHQQWLGVSEIGDLEKDGTLYPTFTPALRQAMRNETGRFADYVIRQADGRLATLLTAPYSLIEDPLRALYGLGGTGDPGTPTSLDPSQRAGLLTQAAFLATNAHANQTSPVHRGVVVRKNILCQALPAVPVDVDVTVPAPSNATTTRQRFAQHESDARCSACHVLIDGIGLGFEGYDAIGAYRSTENGMPVDDTGQVINTMDINGAFQGGVELAKKLASSGEVRDCVSRQWFRFALGREEKAGDECSLAAAYGAFSKSDYNVKELMLTLVTTDAFRYRSPL